MITAILFTNIPIVRAAMVLHMAAIAVRHMSVHILGILSIVPPQEDPISGQLVPVFTVPLALVLALLEAPRVLPVLPAITGLLIIITVTVVRMQVRHIMTLLVLPGAVLVLPAVPPVLLALPAIIERLITIIAIAPLTQAVPIMILLVVLYVVLQ